MALPKQVQAQIKETEEIEKQLKAQDETVEKPKKEVKKKKTSTKAKKTDGGYVLNGSKETKSA